MLCLKTRTARYLEEKEATIHLDTRYLTMSESNLEVLTNPEPVEEMTQGSNYAVKFNKWCRIRWKYPFHLIWDVDTVCPSKMENQTLHRFPIARRWADPNGTVVGL